MNKIHGDTLYILSIDLHGDAVYNESTVKEADSRKAERETTMKTTFRDYGTTASITNHRDGTATLKIKLPTGKVVHNKVHASHKAAVAAWRRFCA